MALTTSGLAPADTTTTLQNAAAANANGTALTLTARDQEIMVTVVGASAVLSVIHEVSFDTGSNYVNAFCEDLLAAGGIGTMVNTIANPGTTRYRYRIPAGATNFRSRVGSFVSGTVTAIATVRSRP